MPKTLLLADDSVTIQKVVGISFANEDIVLLTVDNGDDAIARARDARPDVILADVVMPGKNGYDVCQIIKADPSLAHIPVLLLTGTFEAFDEQRAARAGADGHITKPFEAQALVDIVNGLLSRPPAGGAAAPEGPRSGAAAIGSVRPTRVAVAPPPPQPVSHTADTAYDFFDDEITAPRGASDPAGGESEPPREDTTVLISQPSEPSTPADDGFAFEEPAAAPTPVLPPRAAAPEEPAFGADELDLGGPALPGEEEPSLFDEFAAPTAVSTPAEAAPAEDFGWSPPDDAPSGERGWEARSEAPSSAEIGWDVQGDTGPGQAFAWEAERNEAPPRSAPPARSEPESADWFAAPPDPQASTRLMDAGFDDEDPLRGAAAAAAPVGSADFALDVDPGGEVGFGEAVLDPHGARDYDVSSSDLGAPLAAGPVLAAPDVAAPERTAAAMAPAAAAAAPALERRELHEALEKLAWEAFGPVAESLVREAVERIERIAWEVIPQMAEAMVREEIRKLKGE